jgi:hypothetical protein
VSLDVLEVGPQQMRELHEDIEVDVTGSLLIGILQQKQSLVSDIGLQLRGQSCPHLRVVEVFPIDLYITELLADFVDLLEQLLFELRVIGKIGHDHDALVGKGNFFQLELRQLAELLEDCSFLFLGWGLLLRLFLGGRLNLEWGTYVGED